jgi:ribonuclease VapC
VIVVDASAIVAILTREIGFEALLPKLVADAERRISPISSLELVMALTRHYDDPIQQANAYLLQESILLHPIDAVQTEWAHYAFLTYGKGRHPARLNLGDCFSYAAAKVLNAPLLHVGNDFAQTDILAA